MQQQLDILVIVAHPDDAELGCGGTIAKHVAQGYKVGVIDLTQGELGTRGTIETRYEEAEASKKILGLSIRENLKMADGFFEDNKENQLAIIKKIRQYSPKVIIANALQDRHIDHGRAAQLVKNACFLSGLKKIETGTTPWRPEKLYHMIQDHYMQPNFVVDVSDFWNKKMESILAFKTQFYNPEEEAPNTPISGQDFLKFLEGRGRDFGRAIGVEYGEGFVAETPLEISALL